MAALGDGESAFWGPDFSAGGMTTARLAGRVAGSSTGPGVSFLGRRDGSYIVAAYVAAPPGSSNQLTICAWRPQPPGNRTGN